MSVIRWKNILTGAIRNVIHAWFPGLILVAGCAAPPTKAAIRVYDSYAAFLPLPLVYDASLSNTKIDLSGAINETISFQFTITPAHTTLLRPAFRIHPPTSVDFRLEPSIFDIFRMHPVHLNHFPGWHIRSIPSLQRVKRPMDVLVPLHAPHGGLPEVMHPGENYTFWVDVHIPKGAFEGNYNTGIELYSGGKMVEAIDIRLTVWPLILPDENEIPLIAEIDHRDLFHHHIRYQGLPFTPARDDWRDLPVHEDMDTLLISTLRMLQAHRLTPVLPQLSPLITVNAKGQVIIDWSTYDAVVEPMMNGRMFANRVRVPVWPMPLQSVFSKQVGSMTRPTHLFHDAQGETLRGSDRFRLQYLDACANHFAQKGWLDRTFALRPNESTLDTESALSFQRFADAAHQLRNKVRVASQRFPQDLQPFGWVDFPYTDLTSYVDIWLPPAQFFDADRMADLRDRGCNTWITLDRPPYSGTTSVFAPSTYTRVISWQAERLGAEAVMLGTINDWPADRIDPVPDDCVRSDPNVLLYPGRTFGLDQPVASVRLKHLRTSMQDAAYRKLLKEHHLTHIRRALMKALTPYAGSDAYRTHFADGRVIGWSNNTWMYQHARDIMAEQLIQAAYERKPKSRIESFAQSSTWRRFMLSTRKIDLRVDGCRVRLSGTRPTWSAEVECGLTLVNHSRSPIAGKLCFADLPGDALLYTQTRTLPAIPPYESRHVVVSATVRELPTNAQGVFNWPVIFTTDDGDEHRVDARVSMISAAKWSGSIHIDGDLSDWPPGTSNVASDFRLITGPQADKENLGHPISQTMGFVMRDDRHLYFAINVKRQKDAVLIDLHRNTVEYDDLIPVGEELVELLFDPLNAGTRSPSDLYHIAVKPSGAYLAEKGVRLNAPCSRRTPWPADLAVATNANLGGWTIELRIPLSAFQVDPAQSSIWGFSITRFDAAHQELSTWSAATGNAYDPLSLGNLLIP